MQGKVSARNNNSAGKVSTSRSKKSKIRAAIEASQRCCSDDDIAKSRAEGYARAFDCVHRGVRDGSLGTVVHGEESIVYNKRIQRFAGQAVSEFEAGYRNAFPAIAD